MKIINLLRFIICCVILGIFFLNVASGYAIDLKLEKTLTLTKKGDKELRPEIHIVETSGTKHIYVTFRKIQTPFMLREFFIDSKTQGKEVTLFPQDEKNNVSITDFGSLFVNGTLYFVAQYKEAGQRKSFERPDQRSSRELKPGIQLVSAKRPYGKSGSRPGLRDEIEKGDKSKNRTAGGNTREQDTVKLKLIKYDDNFKIIKSVIVLEEDTQKKNSLVTGGSDVEDLIVEQGDDPGMVSDGKNIYVITEIRKRGKFEKDQPQYRVHAYDLELNPVMVKDIAAGPFNGGFNKLVYPVFRDNKFWLLGEFVPDGYGDPDLPPRLRTNQPNDLNKDLFVMQYDQKWNPVGDARQLAATFPGMEYYATGFLPYKDYLFATYSYTSDNEQPGRLGDGKMRLSIFDKNFKRLKEINISDMNCAQGNIVIFDNYLLMVHSDKDIPKMSKKDSIKGGYLPLRADIVMNIFRIVE